MCPPQRRSCAAEPRSHTRNRLPELYHRQNFQGGAWGSGALGVIHVFHEDGPALLSSMAVEFSELSRD